MNNLEELKQELKKLENKINKLESREKEEVTNKYKRERYRGDRYLSLDYFGDFTSYIDLNDKIDNFNYNIGNYFKTKKQVGNYKEKLLIEQKLKDIAMELNKGEKIDWDNDSQYKYYLYYNFSNNEISYRAYMLIKLQGIIYCLDENFKDVVIERIGEERLTRYLKGELD